MSRKNLDGLLLHVCRTRFFYLKDEENLELQAFSNFYREACGCFAFSEILYKNKGEGLLNSALVAVGFREDKDSDNNPYLEDCFIEDVRHGNSYFSDFRVLESEMAGSKKIIPFGERIVSFLHATSRDLYLANVKLEEAATTDGLTKIYNRKKISECIVTAINEKNSTGSDDLNLIMFDIDNFKRINDTYGHDMGDEVLKVVAQTAKKCIGSKDSIGRWGGEEFMILLPDSKKDAAISLAEKIRSQINAIKWEKMPCVSVSVGVSELCRGDDCQTLYKRVDGRLYYAKMHGKNRVIGEDYSDD
jgi:diguanylate cyclase (GGDEF)-like protein